MCGTKQPRTKADVWLEAMIAIVRSRSGSDLMYMDSMANRADEVANAYEKRFLQTIPLEKQ